MLTVGSGFLCCCDPIEITVLWPSGVLLPFPRETKENESWDSFSEQAVAALSKIVEATGAEIVLSSTWRADPGAVKHILAEFQRFSASHGGPLGDISALHKTTSLTNYSVRQWEVVEWVEQERHARSAAVSGGRRAHKQGNKKSNKKSGGVAVSSRHSTDTKGAKNGASRVDSPTATTPFAWVALDDDESLVEDPRFLDLCKDHTVMTASSVGLTSEGADQAIAMLVRQGATSSTLARSDSSSSSSSSSSSDSTTTHSNGEVTKSSRRGAPAGAGEEIESPQPLPLPKGLCCDSGVVAISMAATAHQGPAATSPAEDPSRRPSPRSRSKPKESNPRDAKHRR
jgi:hypothetical protein